MEGCARFIFKDTSLFDFEIEQTGWSFKRARRDWFLADGYFECMEASDVKSWFALRTV